MYVDIPSAVAFDKSKWRTKLNLKSSRLTATEIIFPLLWIIGKIYKI